MLGPDGECLLGSIGLPDNRSSALPTFEPDPLAHTLGDLGAGVSKQSCSDSHSTFLSPESL